MDRSLPPQFRLHMIVLLWLAVAIPMPVLAFWAAPRLAEATGWHPGIALWTALIAGMVWQAVLSLLMLWREAVQDGGRMRWQERIWWQLPRQANAAGSSHWLLLWLLPVIGLTAAVELTGLAEALARPLRWLVPALAEVPAPDLSELASPAFNGAWWLLGLWAVSSIFNYFLGEELFFRGLLLPRMKGAFGRWDWLANGVLFGAYHMIRPLTIPAIMITGAVWALPCARYRSCLFAVLPHLVEGLFVLVLVLGVVTGRLP